MTAEREAEDAPPPWRPLAAHDVLPAERYVQQRELWVRELRPLLDRRRLWVGPEVLLTFENRASLWFQLQEELAMEGGDSATVAEELATVNSLIPGGRDLVAAMMIEVGEATRRRRFLAQAADGGPVVTLQIGGYVIDGVAALATGKPRAEGRASPVQFVRFPLSEPAAGQLMTAGTDLAATVTAGPYRHTATLTEAARAELAGDLTAR